MFWTVMQAKTLGVSLEHWFDVNEAPQAEAPIVTRPVTQEELLWWAAYVHDGTIGQKLVEKQMFPVTVKFTI